jgi:hypothetical protein
VLLPGGLLDLTMAATTKADPNGGWDGKTRYSATNITLSGTTFNATISGGGTSYVLTSITGTGAARVLNGTAGGSAFALTRKTGVNGASEERHSPTLGLRPDGKPYAAQAQSWFVDGNKATEAQAQADLTKWKNRDNGVQLKHGNFLYRGVQSAASHTNCFLHIEYRSPFMPTATGQNRGNSGIYLRGMHEQQVLDSFGSTGLNDDFGAVYKIKVPLVNAALPPLTWQTYDIYYTAGSGTNGTFTTYANGVLVQENTPVSVVTEAGFNGTTLYLQNHGNEVIFNNIWIVPNATPASLPYNTILGPVGIGSFRIAPKAPNVSRTGDPSLFFDATGRAIQGEGRKLPTLLLYR